MKTLTKNDHVSIVFGEWFDRINGNTYYDALVRINDERHEVTYKYGYNHGDTQAIDEALESAGYRIRANKANPFAAYRCIHTSVCNKLKRELYN